MVVESVAIGVGACIVFDLWQRAVLRLTGIPPSNWALAGRWLLRLLSGGGLIAAGLATMPERRRELAADGRFIMRSRSAMRCCMR